MYDTRNKNIERIEESRDAFIEEKRRELQIAEDELVKAQGRDSGSIEKN